MRFTSVFVELATLIVVVNGQEQQDNNIAVISSEEIG